MFELLVSSPYDREHLVVEIWFNDTLIAEINREKGVPEIELYTSVGASFDLAEFNEILQRAMTEILSHK